MPLHPRLRLTRILCLLTALTAASASAEITHRVAVLAGTQAPGFELGVTIASTLPGLLEPSINQAGDVACYIVVQGPGIIDAQTNGFVVVVFPAPGRGPARLIARNGVQAPGEADGLLLNTLGLPQLTESGRVLFNAALRGTNITAANDQVLYLEKPEGGLALLLREGSQAPGLPAGVNTGAYDNSLGFALNATGQVVVQSQLTGVGVTSTNDSALYTTNPANPLQLIAVVREGDPADFVAPGIVFGNMSQSVIASTGDVVFVCALAGAGVSTTNDRALILRRTSGALTLLAREGDPIPAAPGAPGGNWGSVISLCMTPADLLGFSCGITGLPVAQNAHWSGPYDRSTPFRPAGVLGTPILNATGLTVNASSTSRYALSDTGRVAFYPSVAGTGVISANDSVMLTEAVDGPGNPRLLAREGSPCVGITPSVNHPPINEQSNVVAVNARNQTAFIIRATSLGNSTDHALWAVDDTGLVSLVSFRDHPFTVAPGDVRTISYTGNRVIGGPQSAGRSWFNNRGDIVYSVAFVGDPGTNSAIIVSTIDPPPPACRADFNNDGADTLQDLFDFLFAWFAQTPTADINGIDGVTLQDLFDFLFYWFQGC